ncbi:MAG TPA: hypothetical protein VHA82_15040 [Ramlibacter sp.]|uniref:hypothetical protein n=1 Tax=Ramlibacter sp. TaxID=1917967 RepID=UPI002C66749F|nr:hypothetical protein [Ramlibacter sp.]HVZ45124.1 hypothetical protein [Ramlibacter sp.]
MACDNASPFERLRLTSAVSLVLQGTAGADDRFLENFKEFQMALILWLLGVPLTVIILLKLFGVL